jgi:hypothetical protein
VRFELSFAHYEVAILSAYRCDMAYVLGRGVCGVESVWLKLPPEAFVCDLSDPKLVNHSNEKPVNRVLCSYISNKA